MSGRLLACCNNQFNVVIAFLIPLEAFDSLPKVSYRTYRRLSQRCLHSTHALEQVLNLIRSEEIANSSQSKRTGENQDAAAATAAAITASCVHNARSAAISESNFGLRPPVRAGEYNFNERRRHLD